MDFLSKSKNGIFWPKMTKNSQNDKTPTRHVVVFPHQKSERKSGLERGPVSKTAIFGQKVPEKCHFVLRLVRYWQSDFRFWRFRIFGNNKVVLVFGFLAKIKKRHFLAEKILFLRKNGYFPFSIAFLWSLYSWIGPNF